MPQPYDAGRDDIAEAVMGQNKGGALGAGLAGLAGGTAGMQTQMPAGMLAGMPQTPAGGVPGSGLAPAAPSIMPQQPMAQQPRAQGMGTMPELSSIPWQGGGMPQMGGIGAMGGAPQGMPMAMPQRRRTY